MLSGCLAVQTRQPLDSITPIAWRYADLRLLDEIDAPAPEQDIVAAYVRINNNTLEIRLDFLDLRSEIPANDLYITIDTLPGGSMALPLKGKGVSTAEFFLRIPAGEPAEAVRANGNQLDNAGLRVARDASLDMLTIRFNPGAMGGSPRQFSYQAFLTSPGSPQVVDSTAEFALDSPPPERAPLLLAFWNTLPAATPAQALRRWDGAHTGPAGRRHGLAHVLDAAAANRVPVTLLDLKTPESLAALDVLGGLAQVQSLAARGLLLLPDVVTGAPVMATRSLDINRAASRQFGLNHSQFLYGTAGLPIPLNYRAAFTSAEIPGGLALHDGVRLVSLAGAAAPDQVTEDGLSLAVRAQLLKAAMRSNPPLTVLGGSLPSSHWGDLVTAVPAFAYIAAHPWIDPWGGQELLIAPLAANADNPLPAACVNLLCQEAVSVPPVLLAELETWFSTPDNPAGESLRALAETALLNLTRPAADPRRAALQQIYLPDLSYLAAAGKWAQSPYAAATCSLDLDHDSVMECVLSNADVFAVIEPEDGSLVLAVWMQNSFARPGVIPSSYFAVGLSDPSEWKLESGRAADPAVIRNAFAHTLPAGVTSTAETGAESIRITFSDSGMIRYRLHNQTLNISFDGQHLFDTRIPLAPGSASRDKPGWARNFAALLRPDGKSCLWGAPEDFTLSIKTSAGTLTPHSWLDSAAWMSQPEDPDRAYPPGHFLPYPLAVIFLHTDGADHITLAPGP